MELPADVGSNQRGEEEKTRVEAKGVDRVFVSLQIGPLCNETPICWGGGFQISTYRLAQNCY